MATSTTDKQDKVFCPYCGSRLSQKHAEGRLRLYCGPCDVPIYENPIPASALLVLDGRQRVLLVRRSVEPKAGQWCLPGGFMELGESPEESALRELLEETGLSGRISQLLGVTTGRSQIYDTVVLFGYLVKDFSGEPEPGDDASDVGFFPFDALPEIAFESHKRFIRIYFAGYAS